MEKMIALVLAVAVLMPLVAGTGTMINPELCAQRKKHWTFGGKNYLYSELADEIAEYAQEVTIPYGREGKNFTGHLLDFEKAVKFCSRHCMELISLETQEEWNFIRNKMHEVGTPFVWTSGHICDKSVAPQCFTSPELQPRLINGWFWSGSGAKIGPTNMINTNWTENPWGTVGALFYARNQVEPIPQPDNAEQVLKITTKKQEPGRPAPIPQEESCLALATDHWEKGTYWNDIACYHQKTFICEDNYQLLATAGINPDDPPVRI